MAQAKLHLLLIALPSSIAAKEYEEMSQEKTVCLIKQLVYTKQSQIWYIIKSCQYIYICPL